MATTTQRLRTFWEERNGETAGIVSLAVRYWPIGITIALITLGAILRLWDLGDRAIHHDESIHIKFAWDITKNGIDIYKHDPVYHGPFQYFAIATAFKLAPVGDNEYTARLAAATFGILLLGLPWLLRKQLGTLGAIVATGLLAVSPVVLYVSRFAREDMYTIFFTLGMAVCIWRYLSDRPVDDESLVAPPSDSAVPNEQINGAIEYLGRPHHLWLIAIGPLMALSFATKETTPISVAIFLVFINFLVAWDLIDQYRQSRTLTTVDLVITYVAFALTAWAVVALWPFTGEWRKRLSLDRFPAAGALIIVFGTLAAPQFAAAIQLAPLIEDGGYMREHGLMQFSVLVLIFGAAFVGFFWNWRVWLAVALLFYIPFVLLFTSFFTNMGGFWTGIWGSMDYWLSQHEVRRGSQPDYYYFMLTPVYEFLPLIFALGGTFYYAFRGRAEQKLLTASALLLIFILSIIPGDTPLIGGMHIHLAFLVAIVTVLMLPLDVFTKFLIYWTLAIFFGITIAGEKMPWLTVHVALPLSLLAARVISSALSSFPEAARKACLPAALPKERRVQQTESTNWLTSPWVLLVATGVFALLAALIFQARGMTSGLSVIAWMLSAGAAICVFWLASRVSPSVAGQVAMVGLFSAMLVFTVRAAGFAAYDQGDVDGYPRELLIYAQGSPKLGVIADEIDRIAEVSGKGHDLKIYIDNTGNIWPWPWYMRDYTNVEYTRYDEVVPEAGSVVLIQDQNRGKIEPYADQFQDPVAYTHMWWFLPQFYLGLNSTDFLGDVITGHYWGIWRDYFIDRTVPGATPATEMYAYFPRDFPTNVPPGETTVPPPIGPVPESDVGQPLSPDIIETIAERGTTEGSVNQPAGVTTDADGNVYVADRINHRIEKFAPDGEVSSFGEAGSDPGQFGDPYVKGEYENHDGPWGIAVDDDGNIYVADTWNHRIQAFGPDFEFIRAWGVANLCSDPSVCPDDSLFGPRDIAVDAEGNLLVVDTGNKRIAKWSPDGVALGTNGTFGTGEGQFDEPSSISIAPNGDVYVADYWNQRIQHFDSDFQYIDEIAILSWGSHGITDRAYIVAIDGGRVLATDPANGRIAVLDANGDELGSWRIADSEIPSRPIGIAWDGANVYISDALISDDQPVEVDDVSGALVRVPLSGLVPRAQSTGTP